MRAGRGEPGEPDADAVAGAPYPLRIFGFHRLFYFSSTQNARKEWGRQQQHQVRQELSPRSGQELWIQGKHRRTHPDVAAATSGCRPRRGDPEPLGGIVPASRNSISRSETQFQRRGTRSQSTRAGFHRRGTRFHQGGNGSVAANRALAREERLFRRRKGRVSCRDRPSGRRQGRLGRQDRSSELPDRRLWRLSALGVTVGRCHQRIYSPGASTVNGTPMLTLTVPRRPFRSSM